MRYPNGNPYINILVTDLNLSEDEWVSIGNRFASETGVDVKISIGNNLSMVDLDHFLRKMLKSENKHYTDTVISLWLFWMVAQRFYTTFIPSYDANYDDDINRNIRDNCHSINENVKRLWRYKDALDNCSGHLDIEMVQ